MNASCQYESLDKKTELSFSKSSHCVRENNRFLSLADTVLARKADTFTDPDNLPNKKIPGITRK
jgi:hypothetical protein